MRLTKGRAMMDGADGGSALVNKHGISIVIGSDGGQAGYGENDGSAVCVLRPCCYC